MIAPGPTKIAGKECHLIEDYIAQDVTEESTLIGEFQGSKVCCATSELSRLRNVTSLPLYGVWQVLIASGVLANLQQNENYKLYHNEERVLGQLLLFSNEADGGITTENILFADANLLGNAEILAFDKKQLRLPKEPILTVSEKLRLKRTQRRKILGQTVALTATVMAAFILGNTTVNNSMNERAERIAQLENENQMLYQQIKNLEKQHFKNQHYSEKLSPVIYFFNSGLEASVKELKFRTPPYNLILHKESLAWERKFPEEAFTGKEIIKILYPADGTAHVFWR